MNLAVQRDTTVPHEIAHYRLVTKLGEGGMGEVFLAVDTKLDRKVAVKIVRESDPGSIIAQRFEREAKSAAALSHPNILAVHDYGRSDSLAYVVMELLEGQSLRQLLRSGSPPLRQGLAIAQDIAGGLAAAHEKRILHRDLKPDNIFITRTGQVKILDFGLAKRDGERRLGDATLTDATRADGDEVTQTQLTSAGTVLGTAGYMSPEQIRGTEVGLQADIFAFGALLYEILSGRRAFREESAIETMHAVLRKEPDEAPLRSARIPPGLRQIVRRCLAKDVADRYGSASEVCVALRDEIELLATSDTVGTVSVPMVEDRTPERVAENSIAVLPFANTSGDPETEYFSDGTTEEIISVLSQLRGLRVAGRTSSFAFKSRSVNVRDIGRELGVDTILEGSVRRAGDRVRVTAQLVNVEDGYQLWSHRYDRELDDVFAIQEDIADKIARALEVTLSRSAGMPVVRHATDNIEAYDLYLRGRHLIEQRGDGVARGLGVLQRAIELDPGFAPAYAGSAEALVLLAVYEALPPSESMPKAKLLAEKAVELDPELAEAHNALAMIRLMWDWDWDGARDGFHRALGLNPSFTPAMFWHGLLYRQFVRGDTSEALVSSVRATVLDPLGILPIYSLGLVLVCGGRYEEAEQRLREGLERDPGAFVLHRALGSALLGMGRTAEAVRSLEVALETSARHPWVVGDLGVALAHHGETDRAARLQAELEARRSHSYTSSMLLALIPTALDDREKALGYLEEGLRNRDALCCAIRAWPSLGPLQEEPRLLRMIEQMGLPPAVDAR